jgi:hypothetical protein
MRIKREIQNYFINSYVRTELRAAEQENKTDLP